MDKKFHPTLYNGCNFLSMPGLKLTHVSKRGPLSQLHPSGYFTGSESIIRLPPVSMNASVFINLIRRFCCSESQFRCNKSTNASPIVDRFVCWQECRSRALDEDNPAQAWWMSSGNFLTFHSCKMSFIFNVVNIQNHDNFWFRKGIAVHLSDII